MEKKLIRNKIIFYFYFMFRMVSNEIINIIENNLRINPSGVSNMDLIYYLKFNSNNDELNPDNLISTEFYFQKIVNSYCYENIFVNNSNYYSIVVSIIGLLIPFYFLYPRFYKLGFILFWIGIFSFINLYTKIKSLYSHFFEKIGLTFLVSTLSIYFLFFILLNNLNHLTLLFISGIIAFLIINYFLRVKLTLPMKSNLYNQFRATENNNTNYIEYNELLEICCNQVIERFKLSNLPSGNMLYSYLSNFKIGDNNYIITDFLTNLFGPIISIFILWLLGNFLSIIKNKSENMDINLFPIIGFSEESFKNYICQANYILPLQFNVELLTFELITKYNFDNKIYAQIEKALKRISYNLLKKYNPKFKFDKETTEEILDNLKENKILVQIKKLLKNTNFSNLNLKYIDEIKKIIYDSTDTWENKEEMFNLLKNINNTLKITNNFNENFENDSELAIKELVFYLPDEYKEQVKEIAINFMDKFKENLNLKDGILFGYDYNIITYEIFGNKIRKISNYIFSYFLKLISTWLLFSKPIGSPWLITQYILTSDENFNGLLKNLTGHSWIWKYFTMGLDSSYFEDQYKFINQKESLLNQGLNVLYSILIFIVLCPIFYFFNKTVFGLTSSPLWYNLLYQGVFIINILGNYYYYLTGGSNLLFNIKFIIAYILIVLFLSIIIYFFTKYVLVKK
jgi:hypothetical protein